MENLDKNIKAKITPEIRAEAIKLTQQELISAGMPEDLAAKAAPELVRRTIEGDDSQL